MRGAEHVAGPAADRVALPVLADQEVVEETRRAQLREPVPRHDQDRAKSEAAEPGQPRPHDTEVASPRRPGGDRDAAKHDGHRALGHQPNRKTDEERIAPKTAARTALQHRFPERDHRKRGSDGELGVGHHGTRCDEEQHGRDEHRHRLDRHVGSIRAARQQPRQEGDGQAAEERRQARCEFIDAERAERSRGEPDGERRLAPERHAVMELRHEPVAGLEHLARDLRISCLRVVHQRISAERGQACDERQRNEAPQPSPQSSGGERRRCAAGRTHPRAQNVHWRLTAKAVMSTAAVAMSWATT